MNMPSHPTLTNTIIAGHGTGISVTVGNTATLEATLWGAGEWGNGQDWAGERTVQTGTVNVWGDPGFVSPEAGDYHIHAGSAALDAGVDAGVTTDIDREPRPMGAGYDIGADELRAGPHLSIVKTASVPLVEAGARLTYTLHLENSGTVSLTATVTDALPAAVSPGGILTWTPALLPPLGEWTATVYVTVAPDYAGPLTNVVQATALEGAAGVYTQVTTVEQALAGLHAANDSPSALGQPTLLTATVTAGSSVTYTWAYGDGQVGHGAVTAHTYPGAGAYTAVVTAANPLGALASTTLVTIVEPVAGLAAANDGPTALGAPTTLTATVAGGSDVTYAWALGDGEVGWGAVVTHTYPAAGHYTAVVTATNPVGAFTATTTVTVNATRFQIYLPLIQRGAPLH